MRSGPETSSHGSHGSQGYALPNGTRLAEFEIEGVLGTGGFGIVYIAMDHSLMRYVAIKEYAPSLLTSRDRELHLALHREEDAESFVAGLSSFLNEARLLASFDHPSLVKVHRFWEQNGTAYMAMPYYPGRTLKDVRRAMSSPPNEKWLLGFIRPLLGALEVMHRKNVYHRDISPDNIMLLPDGRPVLLDFGSARRVLGQDGRTITAVLKPNFAPLEQYGDSNSLPQGPWTDLYAVGAVVYYMLKGKAPTPAVVRALDDDLVPLAASDHGAAHGVSKSFLAAFDWAMAVNPLDRPSTVTALMNALAGDQTPPPKLQRLQAPAFRRPRHPAITRARSDVVDIPLVSSTDPTTPIEPRRAAAPSSARGKTAGFGLMVVGAIFALGATVYSMSALRESKLESSAGSVASSLQTYGSNSLSEIKPRAMPASASRPAMENNVIPAVVDRPLAMPTASHTDSAENQTGAQPKPTARASRPKAESIKFAQASGKKARPKRASFSFAPIAECSDRNAFTKQICVRRACQQPRLRSNAQCVQLRADEQRRLAAEFAR